MVNFKITCRCGHFITKNDDLLRLSLYKVKQPTLRRTQKNEKIIEETFYYYICPKCERDVVVIKRKAINGAGNIKALIPEKLIGEKASNYLKMTENNRVNKTSELRFTQKEIYCKGVPLSYFKTISATVQRPRYINEIGYSGKKIESELKVFS